MTTTTTAATDAADSLIPQSFYNIQYPNSQRGMFSLRQPFKDMSKVIVPTEPRQPSTRKLTPAVTQPTVVDTEPRNYLFLLIFSLLIYIHF